jgi:hypothetical protein
MYPVPRRRYTVPSLAGEEQFAMLVEYLSMLNTDLISSEAPDLVNYRRLSMETDSDAEKLELNSLNRNLTGTNNVACIFVDWSNHSYSVKIDRQP